MKNILKSNGKLLYAIVVLSVTLLSLSYGLFVITSSDYKSSELMVGNLLYGITIHDTDKVLQSNPVTVEAGETTLYITISSVNSIASKYTLAYNNNNVTVSASNKSGWNASGSMATYQTYAYSKTVKVVVTNNSGSNQSVTFAAFGGYSYNSTSNIPLGSGWYSVANFSDVTQISGELLTDIVEEDTNCNSSNCLYGGEASTNYFSFEEDGELYRIIGTYLVDNEKTTKIATNTLTEVTTSSNLSTSLNTIKSSLDTDHIYSTNKFNCQGTNSLTCTSSSYTDLGILSLDEYKQLEGDNSSNYLYNNNEYYLLSNTTLVSNTNQTSTPSSARIRPTMYLENDVKVTGSGTSSDPYVLEPEGDLNMLAFTHNGTTTDITYTSFLSGLGVDYMAEINCKNGSEATISDNGQITFITTNIPDYCVINSIDLFNLELIANNGAVSSNNLYMYYEEERNATITPSNFYYLYSYNCTDGYTVENINTGYNYTSSQNINIINTSKVNGTCTFEFKKRYCYITRTSGNWSLRYTCDVSTGLTISYDQCSYNGTLCGTGTCGWNSSHICRHTAGNSSNILSCSCNSSLSGYDEGGNMGDAMISCSCPD